MFFGNASITTIVKASLVALLHTGATENAQRGNVIFGKPAGNNPEARGQLPCRTNGNFESASFANFTKQFASKPASCRVRQRPRVDCPIMLRTTIPAP